MKPFTPKTAPWGPPVLLGIPLDHNSSFLRGPAQAPPLIRQAFHSDAWNKTTETRVDLGVPEILEDVGPAIDGDDLSADAVHQTGAKPDDGFTDGTGIGE